MSPLLSCSLVAPSGSFSRGNQEPFFVAGGRVVEPRTRPFGDVGMMDERRWLMWQGYRMKTRSFVRAFSIRSCPHIYIYIYTYTHTYMVAVLNRWRNVDQPTRRVASIPWRSHCSVLQLAACTDGQKSTKTCRWWLSIPDNHRPSNIRLVVVVILSMRSSMSTSLTIRSSPLFSISCSSCRFVRRHNRLWYLKFSPASHWLPSHRSLWTPISHRVTAQEGTRARNRCNQPPGHRSSSISLFICLCSPGWAAGPFRANDNRVRNTLPASCQRPKSTQASCPKLRWWCIERKHVSLDSQLDADASFPVGASRKAD